MLSLHGAGDDDGGTPAEQLSAAAILSAVLPPVWVGMAGAALLWPVAVRHAEDSGSACILPFVKCETVKPRVTAPHATPFSFPLLCVWTGARLGVGGGVVRGLPAGP